jgi:poly-beta-1,6-N-acetyl-D-glucosamine synthase
MRGRLYSAVFVEGLALLLLLGFLFFGITRQQLLVLPLGFDSVYAGVRTVISLIFVAFFFILMARHVLLMIISVADHYDRLRATAEQPPEAGQSWPLISIICPAYNEALCIESSIRSLLTLDYPRYEIIVVDDGSTDDTLVRAKKLEGDYGAARVVVYWKVNGGKATALNYGIQRAAGELVTTIDTDSVIEPQSLKAAAKHFCDPDVGAVAGSVKVVNTEKFWAKLQSLEYIKGLNLVRRAQGFVRAVSIVPGPIGTFRRSALEEVGYYDHDTFAEDCDLTLKLLVAGWKICYEPEAVARTEAPEELLPLIKQRYRWTRGILQALRKHRETMFRARGAYTAIFMLWYMAFESLLWPFMTGVSILFLLMTGGDATLRGAAAYFWFQLLLLDAITTLYCLGVERAKLRHALYAPVERLVYKNKLGVCKNIPSLEEFAGLKMGWGKLDRKGLK